MGEKELRRLRQAGAIATVEPDASTAHQELDSARRHLVSAMLIAGDDPAAALAVGYDAIRKAISAHLRAGGYRVAKGAGYHQRTGEYARPRWTTWVSWTTSKPSTISDSCVTSPSTKR